MGIREELFFLAEYFDCQDRQELERIARDGTDEEIEAAIYESEQKLDGRGSRAGYQIFTHLQRIVNGEENVNSLHKS